MSEVISLEERHLLLATNYLPCLEYFVMIFQANEVMIEASENFQKQTLRNRCYVQTANGIEVLTVPLMKSTGKVPIRDIRIDVGQPWRKKHWRCLMAAYANSPFFEYYAPEFLKVFEASHSFLFDLNEQLLTLCLKFLKFKARLTHNLSYDKDPDYPVFDARSCITDKKNVNRYEFYRPYPYYQTFGNGFSKNLSIVDLIFNMGPEAPEVLRKSVNHHPQPVERTDKNIGLI